MDISAGVKESSQLPGPYDNPGPAQSMEKGRVINNYTMGLQGIPIFMGNGAQCLHITSWVWISTVNTLQDYHNMFYMLHALAVPEFMLQARLLLNSQKSACLCRLSAGIKHVCHYCLAWLSHFSPSSHPSLHFNFPSCYSPSPNDLDYTVLPPLRSFFPFPPMALCQ